jgi:ribosomal protein S18 acetylase RimI-like enzyme
MGGIPLDQIAIRNELRPGDIGCVIHLHGCLYAQEYGYGMQFETYVAEGLCEFMRRHNPRMDRVWVCEHGGRMVGFLLVMQRGDAAQIRYFLIQPEYRGIGLGAKLMGQCMTFIRERGYRNAFLWTTHELTAAAHLYTSSGFVMTEEKESRAFGTPLRERRYDLQLPGES